MKRTRLMPLIAMVCLLALVDQAARAAVRATMNPGESLPVIGDVLHITFVQNFTGFAWFVPPLPPWAKLAFLFVLIFLLLLSFPVYVFYTGTRRRSIWTDVAVVGIAGSCCGHLVEDLRMPYTTDFIQFFRWPSANLAEVYAYVGVAALAVEMAFVLREARIEGVGFRQLLRRAIRARKEFVRFVLRGFRL